MKNLIFTTFVMLLTFSGIKAQESFKFCDKEIELSQDCKLNSDEKKIEVIAENFKMDLFYLNHWEKIETPVTAYIDFLEIDNFDYEKISKKLNVFGKTYDAYLFKLKDQTEFSYRVIAYGMCGDNKFLIDFSFKKNPEDGKFPGKLKEHFKFE